MHSIAIGLRWAHALHMCCCPTAAGSIQHISLNMTWFSRMGMQCKKAMIFIMVRVHNMELSAPLVIQAQALH